MQGESWLCPTELDRSRVVDANARARTIRMVGTGAIGLALLIAAPWLGWTPPGIRLPAIGMRYRHGQLDCDPYECSRGMRSGGPAESELRASRNHSRPQAQQPS